MLPQATFLLKRSWQLTPESEVRISVTRWKKPPMFVGLTIVEVMLTPVVPDEWERTLRAAVRARTTAVIALPRGREMPRLRRLRRT